jgi:enoyl-CoA hydratase/carnithine racemase
VIERAEAALKKIIANDPLSLKYALEAVNKGLETSVAEGLLIEASLLAIRASPDDKKEGSSATLEKRAVKFLEKKKCAHYLEVPNDSMP